IWSPAFSDLRLRLGPRQVLEEPGGRERGDLIERTVLLEQVGSARDDLEPMLAAQLRRCVTVEVDDGGVAPADDEQRRRADQREARSSASASVRRSKSRVPSPCRWSVRATSWLRGL